MSNPVRNLSSWVDREDRSTLFMCGAGGTGKTSVVDELQKKLGERLHIFRSTNRDAVKSLGFKTESEVSALPAKDRWEVQYAVFRVYQQSLQDFVSELNVKYRGPRHGKQVLVLERSPVDYLAYWLANVPRDVLTDHEARSIVEPVFKVAFPGKNTKIVYYPWPTPWYEAGKTKDGFRHVVREIDEAVNTGSLIALADLKRRPGCADCVVDLGEIGEATPEQRADFLIKKAGL